MNSAGYSILSFIYEFIFDVSLTVYVRQIPQQQRNFYIPAQKESSNKNRDAPLKGTVPVLLDYRVSLRRLLE
jgi:hypothetical protein